ncbi:hypothetical protein [Streptomyces sp. NPDC059783]|uniref:hypothetical protein n=1 Tax=Streptomyces sp. NPDC059783 TaxID=3346944 RepID=UPI0036680F54
MTRTALRAPLVLMALVIGAAGTASCDRSTPERTAASEPPMDAATKPDPTPSKTPSLTPATALPKHAVAGTDRPSLAAGRRMADGYTGKDFLSRLAKDWKVKLAEPVEQEMPNGKMRTYIHGSRGSEVPLSAGYADHKNMSSLLCQAGIDQPDAHDFLAACTELSVPGIDHAKADAWLEQATRETDSLYKKRVAETKIKQENIVSGVLTTGPVLMVLFRSYDLYSLRILGRAADR